ncbi:hypothetical protein B0E38_02564 [Streptomyces sp. 111WW2]|uniref:hypothetical protein n=1 Tax=Streptomyces sp. 111WW2 TaxID=1945515 RepID=UPI000D0C92E0|nr:hypothetical protein [Streptomyces sp. 111WW2]PSK57033.1 hypothetical protein B0E38_02564 [Streptomyces sp. 111WW2]
MSRYKPKEAPVIPVVSASGSGADREEQMRKWEEDQRHAREAQAAAAAPAPAVTAAPVLPAQADGVAVDGSAGQAVEPAADAPDGDAPAVPARPSAAGYLPMPEFTQPDSDDPTERLEFYSRGILAVQYAARANHERAEQQKLIGLGLRLQAMKDEELHKTAGFETFGEMTDARFRIKKHQANNILRVMPVAQALEDITTQELKERPLRVLVPVLETHGRDAVRETWLEAARHGNVTDTALKQAANFLGYAPPKELPAAPVQKQEKPPAAAQVSESLRAVERIRELAEQDPARARREAEQLESAVRELVEELAGNLG